MAIVYVLVYKREAFVYRNGWAPELAGYGSGLICVQNALRHAAEAGLDSFDFLRGEMVKHRLIRSRGTARLTLESAASNCATWSTRQWS